MILQKASLRNWTLVEVVDGRILRGMVYDHPLLRDGMDIDTSLVKSIDFEKGIAITRNTEYTLIGKERK